MSSGYDIRKAFSKRLRQLREKAGYSILELSRLSEVSRQHIRDLELAHKYATLKTICKLANALETPPWKLVHFGNERCRYT